MRTVHPFASFHPLVTFFFFASVIVLGVCFLNPWFSAVGLVGAVFLCVSLKGRRALPLLGGMMAAIAALALLNGLFNPAGQTVLFSYGPGRPFTAESLAFGAVTGCMFATMMLWFSSFNQIMTSEKLAFLFGRAVPALSLALTMVLRLVPTYERKMRAIMDAREGIGKSSSAGPMKQRAKNAGALLSLLTTWAFESALVTADSMRSRGFGLPGRTCFASYRFTMRDGVLLAVEFACTALCATALASGAAAMDFFPSILPAPPTVLFWMGLLAYCLLVLIPTLVGCWERAVWSFSLSRI